MCTLIVISHSVHAQEREAQMAQDNYERYYKKNVATYSLEKEKAVDIYRNYFSKNAYRGRGEFWKVYPRDIERLMVNGMFSDLNDEDAGKAKEGNQAAEGTLTEAFNRVWRISEAFRHGKLTLERDSDLWRRCQKAIVHYGNIEIRRPNDHTRFHSSCFAIPTAAVNIYFCHLAQMDAVEKGLIVDEQLKAACDMLKIIGLQAWTQPFRNDETDNNVVQLNRFRKHVWWVGGNALGYRSLFPVAFMFRSIPMVDLLAEVCQKCISSTSQQTYNDSFWTEGFTADGAGWGHGMQCLIWGYPIDGTLNALNMLSMFKGSPWEKKLSRENVEALLNYFRGSNYYYYKGFIIPCLDRYSMVYKPQTSVIRYQGMLKQLIEEWSDSFTPEELIEIKKLYVETQNNNIHMDGSADYNGARWFFNNDDLIKKNDRYHIIVNMASIRCDGLESAHTFADAYNYYTADGSTLFQKSGDEYRKAFGAYDVTAFPGVTAREGMEYLKPVTNWRGYCSKYNFAVAATSGGENAVAGHIFEKMNGSEKKNINDPGNSIHKSDVLYGVKAYKSYFMLGDYFVALGAGITNYTPEKSGNIRTTIDQTECADSIYLYSGKGIDWLIQKGKFAYSVFPKYKKNAHYLRETKTTDWMKMNPSNKGNKNLPETVDILRVWIDHGQTPVDATYGYTVYCGNGMPARKYPFNVLRNDTLVQAVCSADKQVLGAVFYDIQTSLKAKGVSLSVSAPCAVLIEQTDTGTTLSVTDAQMDRNCKKIDVMWNGKSYSFNMPQGKLCGKPSVIQL